VCLEESGAEALLEEDLKGYCNQVALRVRVPVNDNQFGAMVSLAYNIGLSALGNSTVLRRVNQSNFHEAAEAFLLWNQCQGKVLPGLQKRREAEKKLFLT
jgi:lysozyme